MTVNPCVITSTPAEGVRSVRLNRPERLNAIDPALLASLNCALRDANDDPRVHVILLGGEGRAFCAGDDLKDFDSQVGSESDTLAYIERIQDVTRRLALGDKPVVGAIRGWAVGGGLEWVLNCDFAIAASGTRFFFPELRWGLFVTGGVTQILPRLVGLQKARELIMLGERFDADQALRWGMLHAVVDEARLEDEALALAVRIADLPTGPARALKRILARQSQGSMDAAMQAETEATLAGFMDPMTARRISEF